MLVLTVRSVGLGVDVIAEMVVNVDRDAASHHKESRVLDADLMVQIHTHTTEEGRIIILERVVCVPIAIEGNHNVKGVNDVNFIT